MRKNVDHVVTAFLNGRPATGGALSTDGTTIRSYDMLIAQRLGDGAIEILDRKTGPTATTRNHINGVFVAMATVSIFARQVSVLTGHKPHAFRDLAGIDGRLTRSRALKEGK